jgi:hippurate hydrolase
MRCIATGVASAFGATAEVNLPDVWAQLVNNPAETQFIADVAADLVGETNVESLIMGSEDFDYLLEACPGAFINIGIGDTDGPFHVTTSTTLRCRLGALPQQECYRS